MPLPVPVLAVLLPMPVLLPAAGVRAVAGLVGLDAMQRLSLIHI